MSPRARRSRRSPLSLTLCCLALAASCGGGGGDDEGPDPGLGGVGVGVDGVTVFWWPYGEERTGWGSEALELADGSIVAAGARSRLAGSFDPASYDATVLRVDAKGSLLWQQDVGQAGRRELANDLAVSDDGSLLIVGELQPADTADVLYARLGAGGALLWQRSLGGDGWDVGRAALALPDGFLLGCVRSYPTGHGMNPDAALVRVDGAGEVVWEQRYGGELGDELYDVVERTGGGFAFAGRHGGTPDTPASNLWLARTDEHGALVDEATYGEGLAYGLAQTSDGGFVLTGSVPDAGGALDLVVLRVDASGQELWRRTFGGGDDDVGRAVAVRPGGGYLVAGYTQSFTSGGETWLRQDVYLIALQGDGAQIWQRVKGKAPDSSELADSVAPTADGGMILTGSFAGRALLMKADKLGQTVALGDFDVSIDVPDVPQGAIGYSNALAAAEAAVGVLFAARQVGPFALGHLREVLSGTTPAEYCDAGGGFSIVPAPTQPLAGGSFAVDFASCATADPEPRMYQGGYTLAVEAASDDILAASYQITTSLTGLAVTVTDEAGPTAVAAELGYERAASTDSAFVDDTTLLAGATFSLSGDGETTSADQLELETALASGVHRLGPASARVTCAAVAEPLELTVEAASALTGPDAEAPDAGALAVEAPDGSRLVLRAQGGGAVLLELDTDADGAVDLSLQTTWLALY